MNNNNDNNNNYNNIDKLKRIIILLDIHTIKKTNLAIPQAQLPVKTACRIIDLLTNVKWQPTGGVPHAFI